MTAFSSPRIHGIVRAHDRDRYLLAAAMSKDGDALLPLFAFNHEIAKTRELVSEPTLGLIRLQWWRDALEACYNGQAVPHHEVLEGLCPLIREKDLPQALFKTLLTGRETDFEDSAPDTMADLVSYLEQTGGSLTSLALQAVEEEAEPSHISDLSVAYGISGLIRALPYHSAQGRCLVPEALLEEVGLSQADFVTSIINEAPKTEEQAVIQVIEALLDEAEKRLIRKPQGRYLKSLHLITREHIKRIKKLTPHIRDERMQTLPLRVLIRLCFTGRLT